MSGVSSLHADKGPHDHPLRRVRRPLVCRWGIGPWSAGDGPGLLVAALLGGIWGALLARVLAEMWPLGPAGLYWVPCWLWSPFPGIVLGLGGASGALLLGARWTMVRRMSGGPSEWVRLPKSRPSSRWAAAALLWPLGLGILYLVQPSAAPLWGIGALIAGLGSALWLHADGSHLAGRPHPADAPHPRQTIRRTPATPAANPDPPGSSLKGVRLIELAWDGIAFVLPLALYVGTLAPSVLPGDSGEFQFVAPMLGIPHPTGYPLYLILGKLIASVPLRSVAYRLNLLSAMAAAGAVWAVYRSGRALGMRRAAALWGASLLAVSETFWSQAIIAEKYALNAFFVALTLWLGLQWRRAYLTGGPDRAQDVGRHRAVGRAGLLSAWAFCYGLSLAHHRTMLLLAPAYAYLAWSTVMSASPMQTSSGRALLRRALNRDVLHLALLVLAPLLLYLLLPLFSARQPPYAYVRLDSARAFWDLVLARTYQGALFRGGWVSLPGRLAEFARLLSRQFGPIGLAVGTAGWVVLYRGWRARRQRQVAWVLLAGTAAQVLFALNYNVPNTFVYYIPAFVWLAVCVTPALDAILSLVQLAAGRPVGDPPSSDPDADGTAADGTASAAEGRAQPIERTALPAVPRSAWKHLALAIVLIVSAWPMALLEARLPGMDRRTAYSRLAFDHTYGQMAARFVEPGGVVVSDWLPATVLWYTQWVEGQMPAAQVAVVDPLEGQWAGRVESALASGRPAYLARPLMAAGDSHPLTSAGPLVRVLDAPMTSLPPVSHPADTYRPAPERTTFGDDVRLLGSDLVATMPGAEGVVYALADGVVQGGSTLHVTVYWQAMRPPAGDYGVTLRLVDVDTHHPWVERQNRHPVGGTYPTSRWQAGQVVGDYYQLMLPPSLPSGEYELLASMDASIVRATDAPLGASLARLSVRKPLRWQSPSPSTVVHKLLGGGPGAARGLVLVGYDAPGELIPGETMSASLQWLVCGRTARGRGGQSASVGSVWALQLASRPRLVLVSQDGTQKPLPVYGEPNRFDDWQLGALVVDPYRFSVPDDLTRIEVQSVLPGGQKAPDGVRYPLPLSVASGPLPGTNFGNANLGAVIRLRSHAYRTPFAKPGEIVHLTLEWEAVRTMDEAYKVFVHVLGPNGLPIAQQDNEPVNGTYPTTRWQSGERVSDSYAIRLPSDLSPGEYPVEVGLYRISDLSRLPVLDKDQGMVDDKVFLTPLTVK